eukprot:1159130-Pelagomonas_calceolata.AAC.19
MRWDNKILDNNKIRAPNQLLPQQPRRCCPPPAAAPAAVAAVAAAGPPPLATLSPPPCWASRPSSAAAAGGIGQRWLGSAWTAVPASAQKGRPQLGENFASLL